MKKIKVAVVGAGQVANTIHLPSWKSITEAEVTAICDINKEFAEKTAAEWKVPNVY